MIHFIAIMQLCAASLCTPAEQAAIDLAYRHCNANVECMAREVSGGKIEQTESGVTVFRGK